MKNTLAILFASFFALPAIAEETTDAAAPALVQPADTSDLSEFLWLKRPVIVFADTEADPRYIEQLELLNARADELFERDVVVLVDTDPANPSPLRQKLRPRGFMLVLVGKDGGVKLRKPRPWDVRALTRQIDKMPMRVREIRERKFTSGR